MEWTSLVAGALFLVALAVLASRWDNGDADERVGALLLIVGAAVNSLVEEVAAALAVTVPVGLLEVVGLVVAVAGAGVLVVRPFSSPA